MYNNVPECCIPMFNFQGYSTLMFNNVSYSMCNDQFSRLKDVAFQSSMFKDVEFHCSMSKDVAFQCTIFKDAQLYCSMMFANQCATTNVQCSKMYSFNVQCSRMYNLNVKCSRMFNCNVQCISRIRFSTFKDFEFQCSIFNVHGCSTVQGCSNLMFDVEGCTWPFKFEVKLKQ